MVQNLKTWNGPELTNSKIVKNLKILEWSRSNFFWNSPEFAKFWNGPTIINLLMVHKFKFWNVPNYEDSGMVKNKENME